MPASLTASLTATDWDAARLTLELAAVTTVILLAIATPLAWWLARSRSRWSAVVGAIAALPLVLPPTVLGFYLLVVFAPSGPLGFFALPFTFAGLVVGSVIYSLPFAVQPLQRAFEAIGRGPMEAAATLRASPADAFFSVAVPLARPGFITAAILAFAHTVGEFGVVLMIGGNIPGKTRVISTQIYGHVEALEYSQAHHLALAMLAFSFAVLLAVNLVGRRAARVMP